MTRLALSIIGILIVSAAAFVFSTEAIAGYRWPGGGPGLPPLYPSGRHPFIEQSSNVGRSIHRIGTHRPATKHNIVRRGIGSHRAANNSKIVGH